ncbi:hypothetical protein AQ610_09705 [Burkholderia humptydooensis]|nr:hypothetical protein AQ610_09705 [Burkholderia humptydooensis]
MDRVDDRFDRVPIDCAGERFERLPAAYRDTVNRRARQHQRNRIDAHLRASQKADLDEMTMIRDRADRMHHIVAADELDDDVRTSASGGREDGILPLSMPRLARTDRQTRRRILCSRSVARARQRPAARHTVLR